MLPLLRDKLCITMSPDQVEMVRLGRGLQPVVVSRRTVPCDTVAPDEAPWAKALDSLDAGLRALGGEKMDAEVVLSNHFVRYALVPWSEEISDESEAQAFTRYCFTQTYGNDAQRWALRTSQSGYGETQVSSAVDQDLLDGLDRISTARSLRLVSMQPYFMTAFNRWRNQLRGFVMWFVVAEPGRLCVSRLQQGRWCNLQAVKADDDWLDTLKNLLEREFLVSEAGTERGEVYLFAPGYVEEVILPGWVINRLQARHGAVPDMEIQFGITTSEWPDA